MKFLWLDVIDISPSYGGTIQFLHPDEILLKHDSVQLPDLIGEFNRSLVLAKEILKDVVQQVRNGDPVKFKKQTMDSHVKDPKDCFSVHSIYFLCSFGLTHMGTILKEKNSSNAVSGVLESLLVISLTVFKKKVNNEKNHSPALSSSVVSIPGISPEKMKVTAAGPLEEIRLERCMVQAKRLALNYIYYCVNEGVLQEVRSLRSQLKKKFGTNKTITFSLLKASDYYTFLSSKKKDQKYSSVNEGYSTDDTVVYKDTFDAGKLLSIGGCQHSSDIFNNPKRSSEDPVLFSDKSPTKENKNYWKIKKHFREAFLILNSLSASVSVREYSPTDYSPSSDPIRINGTSAKTGIQCDYDDSCISNMSWYEKNNTKGSITTTQYIRIIIYLFIF
jgi:hypothetical protein